MKIIRQFAGEETKKIKSVLEDTQKRDSWMDYRGETLTHIYTKIILKMNS